jgi:hypothetical protein
MLRWTRPLDSAKGRPKAGVVQCLELLLNCTFGGTFRQRQAWSVEAGIYPIHVRMYTCTCCICTYASTYLCWLRDDRCTARYRRMLGTWPLREESALHCRRHYYSIGFSPPLVSVFSPCLLGDVLESVMSCGTRTSLVPLPDAVRRCTFPRGDTPISRGMTRQHTHGMPLALALALGG